MTGHYLTCAENDQALTDALWDAADSLERALATARAGGLTVEVAVDGADVLLRVSRVHAIVATQAAQAAIVDAHGAEAEAVHADHE